MITTEQMMQAILDKLAAAYPSNDGFVPKVEDMPSYHGTVTEAVYEEFVNHCFDNYNPEA